MEKFNELRNRIHEHLKEELLICAKHSNSRVYEFLNRENNKNFNDLYIDCHMAREELKNKIYNISLESIKGYNLICNTNNRKTPDFLYTSLIEECNKELMVNVALLMNTFQHQLQFLTFKKSDLRQQDEN